MTNDVPAGNREGSLEAPTRHPIEWRKPEFYDEAALDKELERVFDICHGCRRCFSLCNAFPTLFDAVDVVRHRRGQRRREEGVLGSRRSLLPLRHVLHDQVSVRAAASVERRLSASDVARQGGDSIRRGGPRLARQDPQRHRGGRPDRRHPGRGGGRQRGQPQPERRASCCRRRSACMSTRRVPKYHSHTFRKRRASRARARAPRGVAATRCVRRRHLGQGRAVRHLLRQSQRTGLPRTSSPSSSTTASR